MKNKRMRKKGFTLVELLIVIAIIAILAAVVAPNAFKAIDKSKISSAESNFREVKTGVLTYYADINAWPTNIAALTSTTSTGTGWNGPYVEKAPANPWGGSFTFGTGTVTGVSSIAASYKYIILDSVPADSAAKLEADLDGGSADGATGTVRYSSISGTSNTLYLVISTQ